jgi:hypothetical protein
MAQCSICVLLILEYERLKITRSTACIALIAQHVDPSVVIFNALRIDAEEARIDCELARLTLEQHRRVHSGVN